jgi:hypothetical protein
MDDKRTVISITPETHKAAKIRATQLGITMQDVADSAFALWLAQESRNVKKQKTLQK